MDTAATILNVVDVEATCWADRTPPGQVSEIIEIGLATVDLAAARRTGRHRILVRPQRSAVSPFCTDLTGLTQNDADAGITFAGSPSKAGTTAARTTPGTSPPSSRT